MNFDGIQQTVISVVAEIRGINSEKINLNSHLADNLGADSLDTLEILLEIEEKLDIQFTDEEAESVTTVEQICNYVQQKLS